MGLISGLVMGVMFGIAVMAGWQRMMIYRSKKRVTKVLKFFPVSLKCCRIVFYCFELNLGVGFACVLIGMENLGVGAGHIS